MGTSGNKDVENKDNAQKQNVSQWAELSSTILYGNRLAVTFLNVFIPHFNSMFLSENFTL